MRELIRWMIVVGLGLASLAFAMDEAEEPAEEAAAEAEETEAEILVEEVLLMTRKFPNVEAEPGVPVILESEKAVTELFTDKHTREGLIMQVDFETQKVLYFRWAGSGQDKLTHKVKGEGDEKTVVFSLERGRTRDRRRHTKVYTVPKSVMVETAE